MKSIFRSTPRSRRARPQQHEAQPEPQGAFFQPKLTINAPGDQYEREADAVADQVVNSQSAGKPTIGGGQAVQRMPISRVQRLATPEEDKMPSTNDGRMAEDKKIQEKHEPGTVVQKMDSPKEEEKPVQKMDAPKEEEKPVQKMDAPKEEEKPLQKMDAPKEEEKPVQKAEEEEMPVQGKEEEEAPVQAKSQAGATQAPPNFSARLSARKGTGAPLPTAARAQMEQGIGADFSQVRIHTDSEAVEMNKDIHAQAFTHGQDIYFNNGKFSPESSEGKRLLAHELTHVVQQGEAKNNTPGVQKGDTPLMPRASTVKSLELTAGKTYTVQAEDIASGDIWDNLSKKTGILSRNLKLFNIVYKGFWAILSFDIFPNLAIGSNIYIPSGDDLALYQFLLKNDFDYDKAVQDFGATYVHSEQRAVLNAGVDRTTGKAGENYGTVDPTFYSPNQALAGASSKRKEDINGQTEYKISWGSEYWKCNIFVNDAVHQAGYTSAVTTNKHYKTAGNLHTSDKMTQITVAEAIPGTIIQYYGGASSDSSHNMILTSFINRTALKDGTEQWNYVATGAEPERASESERSYNIKPDFLDGYEIVGHGSWTKMRFFKPNTKR